MSKVIKVNEYCGSSCVEMIVGTCLSSVGTDGLQAVRFFCFLSKNCSREGCYW